MLLILFNSIYFFYFFFGSWQTLVIIHLHWVEKRSMNIVPNISFCVWWRRLNMGSEQLEGE